MISVVVSDRWQYQRVREMFLEQVNRDFDIFLDNWPRGRPVSILVLRGFFVSDIVTRHDYDVDCAKNVRKPLEHVIDQSWRGVTFHAGKRSLLTGNCTAGNTVSFVASPTVIVRACVDVRDHSHLESVCSEGSSSCSNLIFEHS